LDQKGLINVDFRQKYVTTFDAHADARSAISKMTSCCTNSPNQPMCNLTDVMLSKYYPGARLTVLMIIPANFTFIFLNRILKKDPQRGLSSAEKKDDQKLVLITAPIDRYK
jgi:hypothetical protein